MQVLIVDNSIKIIERLKDILSESGNITAIHDAVSYKDAARLLKEIKPGVVLLDTALPGNGTIELLKEIKESGSTTVVIVLSSSYDDYILRECKSNGADFFFDKYHDFEKIPGLINTIEADKN